MAEDLVDEDLGWRFKTSAQLYYAVYTPLPCGPNSCGLDRSQTITESSWISNAIMSRLASHDWESCRRIQDIRKSEKRATLEELMYICVLEKFVDVGVQMMPRIDSMVYEPTGGVKALTEVHVCLKHMRSCVFHLCKYFNLSSDSGCLHTHLCCRALRVVAAMTKDLGNLPDLPVSQFCSVYCT